MNIFSAASIMACAIYLLIGLFVAFGENKNQVNRLFIAFCFAMAIWSFAYSFVYVTNEAEVIWMEISAVGWCTFSSFALQMVLLLTENKIGKKRIVQILLYFPSALFFYISVFLFWKDARPSKLIENFFYIGDFIYHFSFLLISITLLALWGIKSNSARKRKQAKILVATSLSPFLLNLLTQNILPAMGISIFPNMGHIFSVIMIIGIYYTMIKYRLFAIEPSLLMEGLLQEMMDLMILLSPDGRIIKLNNSAKQLLGYSGKELRNKPLDKILDRETVSNILNNKHDTGIFRISEVSFIKKNREKVPVNLSCSFIIDRVIKDVLGILIVGQDITLFKELEQEISVRKKAQEYIIHMANHDSLTQLPNRKYFYQVLHQTLKTVELTRKKFAVLFLDVDGLKPINDNYGHEAGDLLLSEVANRIKGVMKREDTAARIGGDEFTFLIFNINGIEDAQAAKNKILEAVNKPIDIYGKIVDMSASIGFSISPDDGEDADVLMRKADNEMYLAKREKKQYIR